MPVGGDIIQLTHRMLNGSIDILNVYYFEAVDGTATLSGLATWFATNVVPDVKAAQCEVVQHAGIDLVNLFDKGEIYELALSGTGGLATTDNLPSFCAGSIRLRHSTAGLRSGYKRIGFADESQISQNAWVAGYVTLLENIADHLINPLAPALATWAHVVVKRIAEQDPATGEVVYGLPEAQAFATVGYPTSYEVSPAVTTQNTRKVYVS